jgi:hypothetical protein
VSEHQVVVEVWNQGVRTRCSCGWVSAPKLTESLATKQEALAAWYRHFVLAVRTQPS